LLWNDFGLLWLKIRLCGLCDFYRQRVALDSAIAAHDRKLPLDIRGGPYDGGRIASRYLDGLRFDAVAANGAGLSSGILNHQLNRCTGVDADFLGDEMPALEQRLDEQVLPHPFRVGSHLLEVLIRQLIAQELHRSNLGEGFPNRGFVDATVGRTDLPFA